MNLLFPQTRKKLPHPLSPFPPIMNSIPPHEVASPCAPGKCLLLPDKFIASFLPAGVLVPMSAHSSARRWRVPWEPRLFFFSQKRQVSFLSPPLIITDVKREGLLYMAFREPTPGDAPLPQKTHARYSLETAPGSPPLLKNSGEFQGVSPVIDAVF